MPEEYKYYAFISYSSADKPWADWIKRRLERYRVPRRIEGLAPTDRPPHLRPIFQDRGELRSAWSLQTILQEALRQSRYLIVICSPHAAASKWVNEEVRFFRALGRTERIIPIIVEGRPAASNPAEGACFPAELRDLRTADGGSVGVVLPNGDKDTEHSEGAGRPHTPGAADARAQRDGREGALLRVIAGLLSVNISAVIQLERRRRRLRRCIAVVLLLTIAGACFWLWDFNRLKVQHYGGYVTRWGVPAGQEELPEETCAHRSSYRFETKRGKLRRVALVNSRDRMAALALRTDLAATEIRLNYTEDGRLQERVYADRFGKVLLTEAMSADGRVMSLRQKNDAAALMAADLGWESRWTGADANDNTPGRNKTAISRYEVTHDAAGLVTRYLYQNYLGSPVADASGCWGVSYSYDVAGNTTENVNLGPDGTPSIDNHGVQRVRMVYDAHHRMVEKANFGSDGEPALCAEGYCKNLVVYDGDGRATEDRYLGTNGQPLLLPAGFSIVQYEFDGLGHLSESHFLDEHGQPTLHKDGYATVKFDDADEDGWNASCRYYDTRGQPCLISKGYARFVDERDVAENIIRERYYGTKGEPVAFEGVHDCRYQYDARGNTIRSEYHDATGAATVSKNGYAVFEQSFDGHGNLTESRYYGVDGRLCIPGTATPKAAVVRYAYRDDGSALTEAVFDEKGAPMTDADGVHETRSKFASFGILEEVTCFGVDGQPCVVRAGIHRAVRKFDALGHAVEVAYFGTDGAPAVNISEGVSRSVYTFTRFGQVASEKAYDVHNNPCLYKGGFAEVRYQYDARGHREAADFMDPAGKLTLTTEGIAATRMVFDDRGDEVELATLSADGKPGSTKYGYSTLRKHYDEAHRLIDASVFDADGKPAVTNHGYHRMVNRYDARGNFTETSYFGPNGQSTFGRSTMADLFNDSAAAQVASAELIYATVRGECDPLGRVVSIRTYGVNDDPILGMAGAHEIRIGYDGMGNITGYRFLDAVGHLVVTTMGMAGTRFTYDGAGRVLDTIFLGPDGGPMMTFNNDVNGDLAGQRFTYDVQGRVVTATYLDRELEPFMFNGSHSTVAYTRDARGNETEWRFLDLGGSLNKGPEGYEILRREYDVSGNMIRQIACDDRGKPVPDPTGTYDRSARYDFAGRLIFECTENERGNPVAGEDGFAAMEIEYDARGFEIERRSLDAKLQPVMSRYGFCRKTSTYDAAGKLVSTGYYGVDRKLVNLPSVGYSQERWMYDDQHRPVEQRFLNAEGKLVDSAAGGALLKFTYDDRVKNSASSTRAESPVDGSEGWARRRFYRTAGDGRRKRRCSIRTGTLC